MASPEELETLINRTAEGDREAFETLYRHSSRRLYGMLLYLLKDRELASDILQEGYIKIWLNAGEFRYRKGSPLTWMISIMRNQAIDRMRHDDRRPQCVDLDDAVPGPADDMDGPLEQTERQHQQARLQQRLNGLPEQQRDAIGLAYFQDLSHAEVAEKMGLPLGTVKTWIRRGLLEMRVAY